VNICALCRLASRDVSVIRRDSTDLIARVMCGSWFIVSIASFSMPHIRGGLSRGASGGDGAPLA
jgi:hypothetical protein